MWGDTGRIAAGFARPSNVLRAVGVRADRVADIIVSHVHWDHLDDVDLFPKARIRSRRAECDYRVGTDGLPAHAAIDTVDARMLADLRTAGRVRLVGGDGQEILPGITAPHGARPRSGRVHPLPPPRPGLARIE